MKKSKKIIIVIVILLLVISGSAFAAVRGGLFEYVETDNCIFTSDGKLYLYSAKKGEITPLEVPEGSYNGSLSSDYRYVSLVSGSFLDGGYRLTIYDLQEKTSITNAIESDFVNQSDAIYGTEWFGNTVLIDCHLNPDNTLFTFVDPFTGKVLDEFSGGSLALLTQRDTYIYRSTYAKMPKEQQHLYLGKKEIYTTEADMYIDSLAVNEDENKICFFEANTWDEGEVAYLVTADILEDGLGAIEKTAISKYEVDRGNLWLKGNEVCLINGMEYSIFSKEKGSFVGAGRIASEDDEERTQQDIKVFIDKLKEYRIDSQNISYQIWFNK